MTIQLGIQASQAYKLTIYFPPLFHFYTKKPPVSKYGCSFFARLFREIPLEAP